MEIDQLNSVPVEAELEEEVDSLQKRRSRLPSDSAVVISSNGGDDTSNGADSETTNGIEVDSALKNGDHSSTDSEIANGFDFESPTNGVEQEISSLHENSVYFDKNNGTKYVDGVSEMENGFPLETKSGDADTNNIKALDEESHIAETNGFSDSTLTPVEDSLEEQTVSLNSFNNGSGQVGDFNSIEEIDQEETEFDVEKVIQKQNTHDLYCPNCHSCITRRVILSRKGKIRNTRRKTKTNKVESNVISELDVVSTDHSNVEAQETVEIHSSDGPALSTDIQNSGREPEVFRCLACFSFFIPTGDGFKMFRLFGDRSPNENVQDRQKIPASNTNWFSSIFRTDKNKIAVERGNETEALQEGLLASTASSSGVLINNTESVSQQAIEDIVIFSKENNKHSEEESIHIREKLGIATIKADAGDGFKMFRPFGDGSPNENVGDLQKTSASNTNWFSSIFRTDKKKITIERGNETDPLQQGLLASTASPSPSLVLINNTETVSQQAREDFVTSSIENYKHSEEESIHIGEKLGISTIKADADGAVSRFTSAAQEVSSEYEEKFLSGSALIHQETNATFSSTQVITTVIKKGPFIDFGNKKTGNDVILDVETSPQDPAVSQTQVIQGDDGSLIVSTMPQTETPIITSEGSGVSLDILKSIVYGGLIESIASLGIVSSAAGAGSTTLNIVALGLANLIGGLFIIFHNLIELKNDTATNDTNLSEDRYQATLGRRGRFPLHATVAIISFLLFGMLSPVIYGFSFRKTDDKDLKLALVGGVSLVCIFLLASGKAYVRRPPKAYITTILYYVITGIMASGVSYVVGDLLNKLMEKLGWFNESSLAGKSVELGWASY